MEEEIDINVKNEEWFNSNILTEDNVMEYFKST